MVCRLCRTDDQARLGDAGRTLKRLFLYIALRAISNIASSPARESPRLNKTGAAAWPRCVLVV